jgi:putative nucleotidyltransferase with HDIG domain
MKNINFDDIINQVHDLPSLPAVVMELLNSLDGDEIDTVTVAKKVAYDQALTAKTLRLANAASSGRQVKVTTVQHAITFLGFQTVRNLITTAAVTGCFPNGRCVGFDDKAFWRHAIATAACAKIVARHLGFNQDYAFTAGLLHDIGRLVLVTLFPDNYAEVLRYRKEHDCHLLHAEGEVLGFTHVIAGTALAEYWHFSETMQMGIAGHHAPDTPGCGILATIIHVADAITHALDLSQQEDDLVPPVSLVAWHTVGLTMEKSAQIFRETEAQLEEVSRILLI